MALPDHIVEWMTGLDENASSVPVKRGEEIFDGTDYPREWDGFIGQATAKVQLQVNIASAKARGKPMEHVLLGSGIAGVGKTTLATLFAHHAGAGIVHLTGPLAREDFEAAVTALQDGDVVFVDEAHLLVQGSKTRADWLLPWMLEGKLYTSRGAVKTPRVTLVAATTDTGKLPATLSGRFMCRPRIVHYTEAEATLIARNLSVRMEVVGLPEDYFPRIAAAASKNPRRMRHILTNLRDLAAMMPGETPDLAVALEFSGYSHDGLDDMAQEILLALLSSKDNTCSIEGLQAQLNEPGPLRQPEQELLQRAFIEITGRGRRLTDAGRARAIQLVRERA